jgi:hypothetical protein
VNPAQGMGDTRERVDPETPLELDERLSGDLAALSDFARELSQLDNRSQDEPRLGEHSSGASTLGRINADESTVEQGLAKLVLTLIELVRRLLEKQAIRRIEAGSLTEEEIERMGETFLKLELRMAELKEIFGLQDEDLNLNLGPLGNLMPDE